MIQHPAIAQLPEQAQPADVLTASRSFGEELKSLVDRGAVLSGNVGALDGEAPAALEVVKRDARRLKAIASRIEIQIGRL